MGWEAGALVIKEKVSTGVSQRDNINRRLTLKPFVIETSVS